MNRLFAAFLLVMIAGCAPVQEMAQNPGQPSSEVSRPVNKILIRFNSKPMTGQRRV